MLYEAVQNKYMYVRSSQLAQTMMLQGRCCIR